VGAPLLGLLANADGLRAVFELVAVFPLLALLLAHWLPPTTADSPRREPDSSHSSGGYSACAQRVESG
jgi:predicted MFS family arabinose efflux permease